MTVAFFVTIIVLGVVTPYLQRTKNPHSVWHPWHQPIPLTSICATGIVLIASAYAIYAGHSDNSVGVSAYIYDSGMSIGSYLGNGRFVGHALEVYWSSGNMLAAGQILETNNGWRYFVKDEHSGVPSWYYFGNYTPGDQALIQIYIAKQNIGLFTNTYDWVVTRDGVEIFRVTRNESFGSVYVGSETDSACARISGNYFDIRNRHSLTGDWTAWDGASTYSDSPFSIMFSKTSGGFAQAETSGGIPPNTSYLHSCCAGGGGSVHSFGVRYE